MRLTARTVLNPDAAATDTEAVELSARLLDALRAGPKEERAAGDLAAQLHGVHPIEIEGDDARIAFWLNLYNALLLNRLLVRPVTGKMTMHPRVFSSSVYVIGGATYSLNQIEHGVLRRNSRAPYTGRRTFRSNDPRLRVAPSRIDPRIHFALNCGARSCPPIRTYAADRLGADLEAAATAYLTVETEIGPDAITLPRLMRLYRGDFGSTADQIRFAADRLPALRDLDSGDPRLLEPRYGRFDWSADT